MKTAMDSKPHGDLEKEAIYFCDVVKPMMNDLRKVGMAMIGWQGGRNHLEICAAVDAAEGIMESSISASHPSPRAKGQTP